MSEQALFQQEFMHNKHAREAVLGQVAAQEGAALVRAIETFFARFVVLPPGALLPLSLWTIGTYMYNAFDSFPYCDFQSPEKRCGKTRATEVMELLAANVIRTVGISEAALFRLVAKKKAAEILTSAKAAADEDESLSLKLLADIRDTWSDGEPTALTVDLIERLKGLEDSPWANDVDLNPRKFPWFLKPFGIESMSVHTVERKAKGYRKDDLETAFARYLVPKGSPGSPAA